MSLQPTRDRHVFYLSVTRRSLLYPIENSDPVPDTPHMRTESAGEVGRPVTGVLVRATYVGFESVRVSLIRFSTVVSDLCVV